MHAGLLDVLHDPADDEVAARVADGVDVDLGGVLEEAVDEHRPLGGSSRIATEVDVDAIRDATGEVLIGGVMEHVEEAGVHSGDSACAIPPPSLSAETIEGSHPHAPIADALDVNGLLNVQYAVKDEQVFVIEANPRARDGAVREQGHRCAAREGRVPGRCSGATLDELPRRRPAASTGRRRPRRGEGGGPAVQPVPRGRHGPRSRDALDGRGHGHRPHVRPGLRRRASTAGHTTARSGHRVPVARRPRQGRSALVGRAPVRRAAASRSRPPRVPPSSSKGEGSRSRPSSRRSASSRANAVDLILGQGRPRREHAPGPRSARRRHAHPPRPRSPTVSLPHHRSPAALRRGRASAEWAHQPSPRSDRCRSTTATARGRLDRELLRSEAAAQGPPVDLSRWALCELATTRSSPASGTFGHGGRAGRYVETRRARRGHGEVGRRRPAGRATPPPRVDRAPRAGMLNSVGLQGRGVEHWVEHELPPLLEHLAHASSHHLGAAVDEYAARSQLNAVAPGGWPRSR